MSLAMYNIVTYISLYCLLIMPRSYKIIITLSKHLFWHFVFASLYPLLIQIMSLWYLILKVIDIVYYNRLFCRLVKTFDVIYYNIVLRSSPMQLKYIAFNSVCYCCWLCIDKNIIIWIFINYSSYWLLYPMIRRTRSLRYRQQNNRGTFFILYTLPHNSMLFLIPI